MSFRQLLSVGLIALAILCRFSSPSLSDPLEVTGKVVASSGKPADGATVRFLSLTYDARSPYAREFATTKSDGSFDIILSENEMKKSGNIAHINVVLIVKGSEMALINVDDPRFKQKTIRLQPATQVTFHLVEGNGVPVAGVAVVVDRLDVNENYYGDNWLNEVGEPWKAITDKLGNVTISNIPCNSHVKFTVDSSKYSAINDIDLQNLSKKTDIQTIHVALPGSISGRVVYSDTNKPAANVDIDISSSQPAPLKTYSANTNSNGCYVAPEIPPGTYTVSPSLSSELSEEWAVAPKIGIKVDGEKSVSNADFQLISGAVITGKVTNKKTGKPLTDVQIRANNQKATPHKDGIYKVHVASGDMSVITLSLNAKSYIQGNSVNFKLADGETKTLDFKVDPISMPESIHGIAVDTKSGPIANANIYLYSNQFRPLIAVTDSHGKFKFDSARPDEFLVGVVNQLATSTPIAISDIDAASEIKLVLDSPVCCAKGQVLDQDGKTIKEAKIILDTLPADANGCEFEIDEAPSDSLGRYWVGPVFAGFQYNIRVASSGYYDGASGPIVAPKGSSLNAPTMKLTRLDDAAMGVGLGKNDKPSKP